MATKREFLVERGLAKPGRGRFSAEAVKALDEAVAAGVTFDEATPAKATEGDSPRVEPAQDAGDEGTADSPSNVVTSASLV